MQKITSKDNKTLKHIQKLIKSSKYRREENSYVIEGLRLCKDAFLSGVLIDILIISDDVYDKYLDFIEDIKINTKEIIIVANSLFKSLSDTKSPQGVMCVCKISDNNLDIFSAKKGKYCALENVQDPTNLGTIFRTAEALGIDGLIVSNDCCDIYSPKVLRGSMGAVFRLSVIVVDDFITFIQNLQENNIICFASTPCKDALNVTKIDFNNFDKSVVLIGNEGNGLTKLALDICKFKVTIPMLSKAESLNASVAASILMWEMLRDKE